MSEVSQNSGRGWAVVLLLIVTVAAFAQVCGFEFTRWDDDKTVATRPEFHPPAADKIPELWRTPSMHLYVPVTYTAWMAIAELAWTHDSSSNQSWLNAGIFHAGNLLVHLMSVLLVFAILQRLFRSNWGAFMGAMVFAIHPLQVETVSWISGLKDLLAGMFSLLALWFYLMGTKTERPRGWLYWLGLVAFVLAMLSKPSAVALPLIISMIDRLLVGRPWSKVARSLWPWLVLTVPIIVIGQRVQPTTDVGLSYTPLWARPLVALDSIAFYVGKIVAPLHLGIDYGRSPQRLLLMRQIFFTVPIGVIVLSMAVFLRRRVAWISAAVGVFVVALLPVLGLVPFDFQSYSTVADHYVYVGMLGVAIGVAAMLSRQVIWIRALTILILVALAGKSFLQARAWQNSETLFVHALHVNPRSLAANVNLGNIKMEAGAYGDAEKYFKAALHTAPGDAMTLNNWGNLLKAQKKYDSAIARYQEALRLHPDYAQAHYNLAIALVEIDRKDEAEQEYRKAIESAPNYAEAHANLGHLLMTRGRLSEAVDQYREALRISPDLESARLGLGVAEQKMKGP